MIQKERNVILKMDIIHGTEKKIEKESKELCFEIAKDEIIKAAMLESAYLHKSYPKSNPSFNILVNKRTKKFLGVLKPTLKDYGIPLRESNGLATTGQTFLLTELNKIWYKRGKKIQLPSSVKITSKTKFYLRFISSRKHTRASKNKMSKTKSQRAKERFKKNIKKLYKNQKLRNALQNDSIINGVLLGDGSIVKRQTKSKGQNLKKS